MYDSHLRGVAPILNPMKKDIYYFKDAIIVDKVIGKAAAMLLTLSKVRYVYAYVISESAIEIFNQYHISYDYTKRVPYIINRSKDGMCPMEQAVNNITNLNMAFEILKDKQKDMLN
ncbi:DUF1893 domain-containing protein [Catenibacterium mitsuokai]|uniref:DUF1893 domain-containing protein n=1 Tax=Catenibacterium mitsuokai TaxID=100886 RepID=UPI0022E2ADDE|nr:DUF1893 domain-containing protein [Catenibacterium mitsuokai]